ncbi:ditrans,polycis-polyprenyl diphosphate synthase [Nematocida homosporus]|uniref:ditrans,polycis-polyprenyl diphosphate synthase n=1 Tax=Nematocida homosporus TaxID=1912981 RepID=UPI00221EFEBF|nr:ditrans,polycis-polyprenyl diphosphate synthase [Nematocida homosporus]KAI5186164.1 ditrans,polycis-polyprenyl diphosphate synthase [Nematocida homosporus]
MIALLVRLYHFWLFLILDIIDTLLESQSLNEVYEYCCWFNSCIMNTWLFKCALLRSFWLGIARPFTWALVWLTKRLAKPGLNIGLVLDGNRRFARFNNLPSATGHYLGSQQVYPVVQHLQELKCSSVALYVWSKKNFNRTPAEVTAVMDICHAMFQKLTAKQNDPLESLAPHLQIVGDPRPLRTDIKDIVQKINQPSAQPKFLFFLFSYSALEEYVNTKSDGVPRSIDIIIRTSGERRLSDFLLCSAASTATICFVATKWPVFSKVHLLLILLKHRLEAHLQTSSQAHPTYPLTVSVRNK